MEDSKKRLQIWEDLDLDFERAKRSREEREKALANAPDVNLVEYYKKIKARLDEVERKFKWQSIIRGKEDS